MSPPTSSALPSIVAGMVLGYSPIRADGEFAATCWTRIP
jgi:hypothetical protein